MFSTQNQEGKPNPLNPSPIVLKKNVKMTKPSQPIHTIKSSAVSFAQPFQQRPQTSNNFAKPVSIGVDGMFRTEITNEFFRRDGENASSRN